MTPTVESVRAACARPRRIIESHHLCLDATIEDYPIGRRERGKCRLQVELAKGKRYRTVRTTTDRHGRWCSPKKSTYTDACIVVIKDLDAEHKHAWLKVGERGVFVIYASGEGMALVESPCFGRPHREPRTVTWTTTRVVRIPGDESDEVSVETQTIPADPPELCDAWDAWVEHRDQLRLLLARVWEYCSVQA